MNTEPTGNSYGLTKHHLRSILHHAAYTNAEATIINKNRCELVQSLVIRHLDNTNADPR
jgi:hypothetical protein